MGPAEEPDAVAGGPLILVRRSRLRTGLFERLEASARVIVVSAPPGSGKTVLLRSWISEAALGQHRLGIGWA